MATLKNQMDSLLSPEDMMLEGLEEGTIEQAAEDLKSFGKGAAFSPVTGAADVVETGKMLPELDEKVKPFFPTYSSIEGAFEELYNLGFNRENAVKAIKNITGVELKSDTAEMAGEIVGLPTIAASKAVGAIAKTAGKYGSKAPEAIERISTEARKLFSAAGGFDDLAVATAGSPSAQTAKMLSAPELPDTSITKIIIGPSGRDYQKKEAAYRSARKELSTTGSATDPVTDKEAQELWNRTGAQEDLVDNDIVYEVPTAKARLKIEDSDLFNYNEGEVAFRGGKSKDGTRPRPVKLSDILDFEDLYEQAPYLKDVEVRRLSGLSQLLGTSAAYNPVDNIIYIASGPTKKLTSNLLHEVEHAVQAADGKTFAGGNFRLIMDQDPEYKKLGGEKRKAKLNKDKDGLVDKYGGKYDVTEDASGEAREAVRGMLTLLEASPNPSKFIRAVIKLPKVEGANRGGGAFKYLSHIQDYMDDNFPEINVEYMSPIDDAMRFIRTADKKTIDALLKDYKDLNLSDLQKFERIKEKAILKYMRDPGEVTARNVQFRYTLSQADPSITRVAPRFTEDKAANPSQIPKMEISDPNKISQPPKDSRSYSDVETLRSKAQELDVPLSDDGPLAITERQGYYLSSSAERGDDAKDVLRQSSEAFAEPLEIGVSEFAQSGKLLKNYDLSTLQEITAKSKAASAGNARADKLIDADVAEGTKVGVRLNLNSKIEDMPAGLNKLQTVHKGNYNGQALSYRPYVTVRNAVFNVNQKGRAAVAAKIKGSQSEAAKNKYNLASVDGNITSVENVFDSVDGDVVEIGFNPASTHLFIDLSTGQAVKNAEIATVVGDRVYAKGVTYLKKAEAPEAKNPEMFTFEDGTEIPSEVRYKMKKGGVVPMKNMAQQMELFADGGLMDEGGMIDEQSGNEVPPGSLREEVRDDIPANLSEGEFVFPADVVRYWGLETLMRMRQEAKMGLKRMEQMGQMGNADEAVIPDDLPFTIDDLDMEDEQEYNFAVGGLAQQGISNPGYTTLPVGTPVGALPAAPNMGQLTTGFPAAGQAATPVTAASATPATIGAFNPQLQGTQFTPTTTAQGVMPTFQQTVGAGVPNVDFEYVEYVNEAGQIIKLRKSKSTGEMLDPIPEGYTLKTDVVESATTTPTTVESAKVADEDQAGDDSTKTIGATISFGGNKSATRPGIVENQISGTISYRGANYGTGPLGLGGLQDVRGLLGRSLSSGMNQLTGGKIGTPMSLQPGESVVISNLVQNRPGVNRSTSMAPGISLELDDKFYNDFVSGKNVTDRNMLAKVADYVNENYTGLGEGSIISASQVLDTINLEESRAATARDVAKAQASGDDADWQTVIDNAIKEAEAYNAKYGDEEAIDVAPEATAAAQARAAAAQQAAAQAAAQQAAQQAASMGDDGSDQDDGGGFDGSEGFGSGSDAAAPICLTEDMKVKLNGVIDFVTNVKVGDIVDNTVVTEVLHKHMREGYYVVNGELKITNDHPVLANGSWKRTEDLVLGDYINNVEVTSLEYVEQVTPTVYIGTADDRYDVYTEGEVYTVHGQYKNGLKQAA